jgi:hypothetical protein
MKTIFTLVVLVVFNTLSLKAQINENFENYSATSDLTNNCWSFTNVNLAINQGINGTKSLKMISVDGTKYTRTLTPYIYIVANTSMTFNVRLSYNLAGQAWRTLTVKLLGADGTYSSVLATLHLNRHSDENSTFTVTVPFSTTGVFRVAIETTASNENNTYMLVDDMVYGSSYNYSSPYACSSQPTPIILPIKLLSFNASLVNNKASMQWSVADNETGKYFEVQKSNDGKTFTTIGVVLVSEKNGTENYSFTDTKEIGTEAYYRLTIRNNNGSSTQSRIVSLKAQSTKASNNLVILQNPVESALMFTYTPANTGKVTVNIYNASGVRMHTMVTNVQAGANAISVALDGRFSGGVYLLEVINGAERSSTRLIKK